jgi:hypothetical protein
MYLFLFVISYLCFSETKGLRELFPLCADDVVVFLERVFQLQQLTGAEGCSYPLGLPEGLQQEPWDVGT